MPPATRAYGKSVGGDQSAGAPTRCKSAAFRLSPGTPAESIPELPGLGEGAAIPVDKPVRGEGCCASRTAVWGLGRSQWQ